MAWPNFVSSCAGSNKSALAMLEQIIERCLVLGPGWNDVRQHAIACRSDNDLHGKHGQQTGDADKFADVCAAHTEIMKGAPVHLTVFNEITHSAGG